jgi:probable selenium-dependent hydroxylase accessory protein YqeC
MRGGARGHELISIVGAGGKTTLLHLLAKEFAESGHAVILTTTTRMAPDQVTGSVCWSYTPRDVAQMLTPGSPLFVMSKRTPDKAVGLQPGAVDRLFEETSVDHVLVEADGARSLSIKAPADHEPVIPSCTTMVIVVVGADALGEPIADVAHRPELVAALAGTDVDAIMTVGRAANVLLHPGGGLKNVPVGARLVMAITKVSADNARRAAELESALLHHQAVDHVVTLPITQAPRADGDDPMVPRG